eukprot:Pgem_evm3s4769
MNDSLLNNHVDPKLSYLSSQENFTNDYTSWLLNDVPNELTEEEYLQHINDIRVQIHYYHKLENKYLQTQQFTDASSIGAKINGLLLTIEIDMYKI